MLVLFSVKVIETCRGFIGLAKLCLDKVWLDLFKVSMQNTKQVYIAINTCTHHTLPLEVCNMGYARELLKGSSTKKMLRVFLLFCIKIKFCYKQLISLIRGNNEAGDHLLFNSWKTPSTLPSQY